MQQSFFDQSAYTRAPRFVVVAAFLVYAIATSSAYADCPSHWRKLASRSIKGAKIAASVPYHVAKAAFYVPVVYPFKVFDAFGFEGFLLGDWKAARAAPWKILRQDKWHLLAYSALATLQRTTGLTYIQYQNATAEFDEEKDDELRVIVNGFHSDDPAYAEAARYIYEQNRKRYSKLILVEAKDAEDLLAQLAAITSRYGKVTHLDYYGHGFPGTIERIDFTGHDVGVNMGDKWVFESKYELKDLPNHLAEGALIRFNSCFAIKGEEGDHFRDKIASRILSEKGGKFFASKVQVLPNAVEFAALWNHYDEPPRWLRTYGDWLSAYNGIFTLASGLEMQWDNRTEAHPFHLQTWDQLAVRPATPQQKHNRGLISGEFVKKLLAKKLDLQSKLLKLRNPRQLLYCATEIAHRYKTTVYLGGDELSLHFEGSPNVIEAVLPRIKSECGPLTSEYTHPAQPGQVRLTIRYPNEDYSLRAATLREFRATLAEQGKFLQDLQSAYRTRLEKLFQSGHLTDYDYRLSSRLLDSLAEEFQSRGDSFDRRSQGYFSKFENKRLAAANGAEYQIEREISERILRILEEKSENFWVINNSVQIFRSDPSTIKKIHTRFPGSSEESILNGSGSMITLALPKPLQDELRVEAQLVEAKYVKAVAALIDEEREQLRRLEADGLLTADEIEAVERFMTSETADHKPSQRFSSILGLAK